jgi:hypothetical protein
MNTVSNLIPKPIMLTEALEAVLVSCRDLTVKSEIRFDEKCGCWPLVVLDVIATGWDGEVRQIDLADEDKEILVEMAPIPLIADELRDTGLSPEKDRIEVRFSVPGGPLVASGSH